MSKDLDLLGKLERGQCDISDASLFRETLQAAMLFLGVTCREIADEVEAAPSSVRRWIKGVSTCAPCIRAAVYAYLIHRLVTSDLPCGWCASGAECPRHPGD